MQLPALEKGLVKLSKARDAGLRFLEGDISGAVRLAAATLQEWDLDPLDFTILREQSLQLVMRYLVRQVHDE